MKWIGLQQILELIDREFGYAQNPEVVRLFKVNRISDYYLHLVDRKSLNRYLSYYAKDHGYDDYSELIQINEKSTKGALYYYNDIKRFLKDPKIRFRIKKLLVKKTIDDGPNGLIPKCIYTEYMEIKLGIDGECEGGYSDHQLELMSVPSELLEEVSRDYEKKILGLTAELATYKKRKNDILTELQQRKDYTGSLKI